MGHLHRNALLAVANVAAQLVAAGVDAIDAKRIARDNPKTDVAELADRYGKAMAPEATPPAPARKPTGLLTPERDEAYDEGYAAGLAAAKSRPKAKRKSGKKKAARKR